MENPSESQLTAPDAVLINATIFKNEFAKIKDEEIMEQIDLGSLMIDIQNLFELYSLNDERFLDITKRVRADELFRFATDNSKLLFDDSELKEWLKSGDDALFTVIVGALAEKIYRSFAQKLGEKDILEHIDQSKDPHAVKSIMKSTKDNFTFILENLLKHRFKFVIQNAIFAAKERAKAKKVIKCWN
jgi:hypothetical protein